MVNRVVSSFQRLRASSLVAAFVLKLLLSIFFACTTCILFVSTYYTLWCGRLGGALAYAVASEYRLSAVLQAIVWPLFCPGCSLGRDLLGMHRCSCQRAAGVPSDPLIGAAD